MAAEATLAPKRTRQTSIDERLPEVLVLRRNWVVPRFKTDLPPGVESDFHFRRQAYTGEGGSASVRLGIVDRERIDGAEYQRRERQALKRISWGEISTLEVRNPAPMAV